MQTKTAKRGNRLLCLLLAVLMVCSLLPMSALAAEENTEPVSVTEEPAAEPEQAAEEEEPSAEPAAVPAVQADETGTGDGTETGDTSDTVTYRVVSPEDAHAQINFSASNRSVDPVESIAGVKNISNYTFTASKDIKIYASVQLVGYDSVHYRFVRWEINSYTSGSTSVDGYVITPGNGAASAQVRPEWSYDGEYKLSDEYVFTAIFEKNESGEPASDEVKFVFDLTNYTGAVSGELVFNAAGTTNPIKLEAGKRNEFTFGPNFGPNLYNVVPAGTITLDDAPEKFGWTVTGVPDGFLVEDTANLITTVNCCDPEDPDKFFAADSKTLKFFYATNVEWDLTDYDENWGGKTIVLTPDFDSLDESKAFTPVVTSSDTNKGTVTAAFGRNNGTVSSTWTVTGTPKNDWYKLDYVEDDAGNKFESADGKTAIITVTAKDQPFTAYFTSAIDPMYEETPASSVKINFTLSNDGIPLKGADGTILANMDITIPYFDLANYNLSRYYRYGTEYGWGSYNDTTLIERPTALHAYIYIIERYYMGIPESECGKGTSGILDYKTATDVLYMDDALAYNSGRTAALLPTGDATSLYMKYFWGHDENLMYFRNHEYPLMGKGWGSTCDYILLSDGDRLDVAMFTNWDFYKDGGFNQFSEDEYVIIQGETITTSTFKAGTSAGLDGESPALEGISGLNVAVYDENWKKIADLTGDGTYSYTFDKAGVYYFMATDTGAKTTDAHYAPATAKVTVMPADEDGWLLISNIDQLMWFQNYVNVEGHYDQKAKLAADIDMTGVQWNGLGEDCIIKQSSYTGKKAFTGAFDGQGHTLTVNFTTAPFVNLLKGTVKNLTIRGESAAGAAFTRYLLNEARIENCVNYASVTGSVQAHGPAAAGFAAGVFSSNGYTNKAGIVNCINYGDINCEASAVGGMIGMLWQNSGGIEVTGCKNYGDITATNFNTYVAGIIGDNMLDSQKGVTLTDCENHGAITAVPTGTGSSANAAGIMAQIKPEAQEIYRCLNTGSVKGRAVGGIISSGYSEPMYIEQCANTGNISGLRAGGIAALYAGEMTDCYNTGDITVDGEATDGGNAFAGGLVGSQPMYQAPNTHYNSVGKVSNCYTTGKVTSTVEGATIGAAVGKLHTGNIVSLDQTTYRDFQVYALEGTCAQLVGEKSENAMDSTSFKTEAELKSDEMLAALGENFKKDLGNINSGYPVLVWQVSAIMGDANGDGIIDATDAVLVLRYYADSTIEGVDLAAADVNGDGIVDANDAVAILKLYAANQE